MGMLTGWLRRPQNVWLRRAVFQVHLWTGVGLGLYVGAISISGSAIVFRNEIYKAADSGPRRVPVTGEKLSEEALKAAVRRAYPEHSISFIWPGKQPDYATEVWMDRNGDRLQRLFNPYTGEDLGPSVPYAIQITSWLMRLHTDLLAGDTGRFWNGVASALMTLLVVTGLIVWWPGLDKWKRSLWVNPKAGWKRLNWDLHSAAGFWTFALTFMWAATGVFLVWPLPFQRVVNHFSPLIQYALPEDDARLGPAAAAGIAAQVEYGQPPAPPGGKGFGRGGRRPIRRSAGDQFIRWLYYLHFGNFAGWTVKALWTVLGLIPALLAVTGIIMWWNRVVSRWLRRSQAAK